MTRRLQIGELARQAGVSVETLRFYERRGLLAEPPRRSSGYRAYSPEAVDRIHFIKRAQQLDFSLHEIKKLLSLQTDSEATCADIHEVAKDKIADVQQKIHDLQRVEQALIRLTEQCPGEGPVSDCPILQLGRFEQTGSDPEE